MKNIFLSGLLLVNGGFSLCAQPFFTSDLLLDSVYYWSVSDEELDSPYTATYFNAYEYDEQYRVKVYRDDYGESTYTYTTNMISVLRSSYDEQGELMTTSRSESFLDNDQVVETRLERFIDGGWVNSNRSVYHRNNEGLDTLTTTSDWVNGAWNEKYRFINRYNEEGKKLEQYRYNITDQGLYLATGYKNIYNIDGLKTQTFHFLPGSDGSMFSSRYDYFYNNQEIVDTTIICSYLSDQSCENTSQLVKTYLDDNTLQQDFYEWINEQWQPKDRTTYYYTPDALLVFPDSVLFSTSDGVSFQLQRSDYITFQELPDSRIYRYSERFSFFPVEDTMALTRIWEHWYLDKEDLVTTFTPVSENALKVYPSPVRSGGQITVEIPGDEKNGVLHCFDMEGRLVASTSFVNTKQQQVYAPLQRGIYNLIFVRQGNVLTAERLVVN